MYVYLLSIVFITFLYVSIIPFLNKLSNGIAKMLTISENKQFSKVQFPVHYTLIHRTFCLICLAKLEIDQPKAMFGVILKRPY